MRAIVCGGALRFTRGLELDLEHEGLQWTPTAKLLCSKPHRPATLLLRASCHFQTSECHLESNFKL